MTASCLSSSIQTNEIEIIDIINHLKEGAPDRDEIVARNIKCISDPIVYAGCQPFIPTRYIPWGIENCCSNTIIWSERSHDV